jgi:PAS domain S-box-containing protein
MDSTRSEMNAGAVKPASFGTWEWSPSSNVIRASRFARTLFGLDGAGDVTFDEARAAAHPEDHGFRLEDLTAEFVDARRECFICEWRASRPDGTFRWVRARGQSEFPAWGALESTRVFGTIEDVDDEKRAAPVIPELERRLKLALDAGRMAIWDYDVASQTLTGSPELSELLGFPRDVELSIDDLRSGLLPEEREKVREAARAALDRGEASFEVEYRRRRSDGKIRWMLLRAEFVFDSDRQLRRIVGASQDVTYTRTADDTNAYLAAVVSSSADAIITFDRSGDILTWNEAAERIFGYLKEEAIGKPFAMLLPNDDSRPQSDSLDRVWGGEVLQFEDERRRQDGLLFTAAVTAAPVRAPNGRIVSIVVTVRDSTSRKNNERRQALLVRELHHRVRNTLATVQAIAGASARYATSLEEFRDTFSQRISSLAQAHALLTDDNWQSVDLRELMMLEVKPYAELERILFRGPRIILDAQAAIPVCMAIHELTTNAARHGALSTSDGRVEISWDEFDADGAREIELTWAESGGPAVAPPSHRGFGTLLLGTILKMQLGAKVDTVYEPEGFRFRLRAALQDPTR